MSPYLVSLNGSAFAAPTPLPANAACSLLQETLDTAHGNDGEEDARVVQTFNYTGDFAAEASQNPSMWRDSLQVRPIGSPLVAVMGLNVKEGAPQFCPSKTCC